MARWLVAGAIRRLKASDSENDDLVEMVIVIRVDFGSERVNVPRFLTPEVDGGLWVAMARAIRSPCAIEGRAGRSTETHGLREASGSATVRDRL